MDVIDSAPTDGPAAQRPPHLRRGVGIDARADSAQAALTFEEIYARERAGLLALAICLTGSRAVAEELTQEAFLRLHLKWARVATYDHPAGWLRRVLVNLATSRARRMAAEARAFLRLGRERPDTPVSRDTEDFWAAVRELPRRQSQVLVLYYLGDRSVAEVAQVLQCAEGTVRVHLHRGRHALQARIGYLDDPEDSDG